MSFRKEAKVEIKEFPIKSMGDKTFYFKKVNGKQLAELFDWNRTAATDDANAAVNDLYWKARIVADSLVNSKGEPEYSKSQVDLDELVTIDADVFAELYVVAGRLIGFVAPEAATEEEQEVAKEAKN